MRGKAFGIAARLAALAVALLLLPRVALAAAHPKREFRGAWIQCVNGQFQGMGTAGMQAALSSQLDALARDGVNAVIFQVRPECDALYESSLEPWSRFLTGRQGQAPSPYWDPLAWMVEQCHRRGMEIHAWINPFRAKVKTTNEVSRSHVTQRHPEMCFPYDGQYILDPGLPESRDYICEVVRDIVARYDIDGLHIDDYFYPYPVAGKVIGDAATFRKHPRGFTDIGDWRRDNVNLFIRQLCGTIHKEKPWVKFGVSPFGIYRNKRSDPDGSDTNGLQNYDDLYADVLLWIEKGWVDYCVPQLYWEIGNTAADYEKLIKWWDAHAGGRDLYIGEDVERTVRYPDPANAKRNQMPAKFRLHEQMGNVNGTVLWYAKAVVDDVGNYGTLLRSTYWNHPALMPLMPHLDGKAPGAVRKLKVLGAGGGRVLFWRAPRGRSWKDKAERYVVYRFAKGDAIDLDDATKIVAVTSDTFYEIPPADLGRRGRKSCRYVVTALDRMSNESKGKKK